MLVILMLYRDYKLISDDKSDVDDAATVFNKLSEMDGCISFDKFITALLEISRRLHGKSIDVVLLQKILKHCRNYA